MGIQQNTFFSHKASLLFATNINPPFAQILVKFYPKFAFKLPDKCTFIAIINVNIIISHSYEV